MTEQFDARKPPVSRTIKQYGRRPQKLDYREMVLRPTLRDTYAVMMICFGIIFWCSAVASWKIRGVVTMDDITYQPTMIGMVICTLVCGAATFLVRAQIHTDKFYAHTKPVPTHETVESVHHVGHANLQRRTVTIDGIDEYLDPNPVPMKYGNDQYTLSVQQVKRFRVFYLAGDMWIRKQANRDWAGCDHEDIRITGATFSRFHRILKGNNYIMEGDNNKWELTDLWVTVVLQLPLPSMGDIINNA